VDLRSDVMWLQTSILVRGNRLYCPKAGAVSRLVRGATDVVQVDFVNRGVDPLCLNLRDFTEIQDLRGIFSAGNLLTALSS
jgi:hypothetical protein